MIQLTKLRGAFRMAPAAALLVAGCSLVVYPFTSAAQAATDSQTPTLTVTVQTAISLTLPDTTIALPALTPGVPVATSSTSTISTNNATGFNFQLNRTDVNTTLDLISDGSVDITDKTEWIPGAATSSVGNSATYSGTGLAFRTADFGTATCLDAATWWGSDGSPLYAGVPTSSAANKKIADCSYYQGSSQDVAIWYRLDVPTTQRSGAYNGTVLYTVTTNP